MKKHLFILSVFILIITIGISAQIPTITSFSPPAACPGNSVTVNIFGTNFTGATNVTIGGKSVSSFTVNSANSITALAPPNSTGNIIVTTSLGTATTSSAFSNTSEYTPYAYCVNDNDYTVSVINVNTNTVVATVPVGNGPFGISISPDGTKAYVANNYSNSVSVISTLTNKVVDTFPVGNAPNGIIVSPDGNKLYVANYNDNTVSVVSTATNNIIATISVGVKPYGVAITPDGTKVFVTNQSNNNLSVINTLINSVTTTISVGNWPQDVIVSPDGKKAYVTNNLSGTLSVINIASNAVVSTIAVGKNPYAINISHDGTKVYVPNEVSGTVSIINTATNLVEATVYLGIGNSPVGVSLTPDDKYAYITNFGNKTVSVLNTSNNLVVATISVGDYPSSFGNFIANVPTACPIITPTISSFSPTSGCSSTVINITGSNLNGATSVTIGGTPATSFIVNSATSITATVPTNCSGVIQVTTSEGIAMSSSTFKNNSGYIPYAYSVNTNDANVSVINTNTNNVVSTIAVGNGPFGISISPDGNKAYVANNYSNTVSVINTATNLVTATIPVGSAPNGICVSPDGSKLFVANFSSNNVSVINATNNTVASTIPLLNKPYGICITPDGSKIFVTNEYDNTVSVINTTTNLVTATILVGKWPLGICISPDGTTVYVVNNQNNSVSIINTTSNTVLKTIVVGNYPYGINISPDGSKVYVANESSNTVSVITTSNNSISDIITVSNPVGVSFNPDGTKAYVTNFNQSSVSVINTVTNTVTGIISVGGNPSSFGNFIANVPTACPLPDYIWTGTTSTDWNDATNWSSGLVPTSKSSIIIPAAPLNQPVLSSDVVIATIEVDGSITINGHTITLNAAVTGTGSLKGSTTSSVVIGGTVGTLRFDANHNSLSNLTINGSTTLGNALKLFGKLTVNTSGTLNTVNNLTLKSVATGTAVVEKVNGTISGIVKVERYIPQGYSAHRDLGVCVSGAGAISNTWGDSLKNYQVYNFNTANGWSSVSKSSTLNQYIGYRVLVSGHNNPIVPTTNISYMNSDVTLAYSGNLLTGNQSIPISSGIDKFSFVSNPYASQVDFNALTKSGVYDGYWYLDPTTLYGNYENYNYYGANIGPSNVFAKSAGQFLQPSQGFFVCSNSATPSLTFTESAKNNSITQSAIFGAATPLNRIAIGLFANGKNLDGAVVVFNNNFSKAISKEDGLKINNQGENLTFSVAGKDLCANGWGLPKAIDELPIHLYHLNTNTNYSLRIDVKDFVGNGLYAYLRDNLLNKQTILVGDSNIISLSTITDTAAFSNRYSIVFKQNTLPVKTINIFSTQIEGKHVLIKWDVNGLDKIKDYKLERSEDGINFTELASLASNCFSYIDVATNDGIYYYRLKAIDYLGFTYYSNIISKKITNNCNPLIISPNPVTSTSFNISLGKDGIYTVRLTNVLGQTVYSTLLNHKTSTSLEKIVINKKLAVGSYIVIVESQNGELLSQKINIK